MHTQTQTHACAHMHAHPCMHTHICIYIYTGQWDWRKVCFLKRKVFNVERTDRDSMMNRNRALVPGSCSLLQYMVRGALDLGWKNGILNTQESAGWVKGDVYSSIILLSFSVQFRFSPDTHSNTEMWTMAHDINSVCVFLACQSIICYPHIIRLPERI